MTDAFAAAGFRIKGWHVLAAMIAFFGAIIVADVSFSIIAVRTFPGQVAVTPYEDGLLYNRKLAQVTAQKRLGWRAAAGAEPRGVVMSFVDRDGAPVSGLSVTGRLERPATESGRRLLRFRPEEPGRYVADAPGLTGAWDLTASVVATDKTIFEAERRLTWP